MKYTASIQPVAVPSEFPRPALPLQQLVCSLFAFVLTLAPATGFAQVPPEDEIGEEDLIDSTGTILIDGPIDMEAVRLRLSELDASMPSGNGDVNADGQIDVSDAIYMLNWVFRKGPLPVQFPCSPPATTPLDEVEPFRGAALALNVNEADEDADVQLQIRESDGVLRLTVHAPDGRRVLDIQSFDGEAIAVESIDLESGDADIEELTALYPEGEYLFHVVRADGSNVAALVPLSHDVLLAPNLAVRIEGSSLIAGWGLVEEAEGFIVEVDQDDIGLHLTVELEADATELALPVDLFKPGEEYDVSLGTVAANGNVTIAEISFEVPAPEPTGE